MIQKIAGKKQSTPLKHLSITNHKITGKKAITDLLAETFSKNSSCQFNTGFYKIKPTLEKKKFSSNNSEEYNKPFTLTELMDSIKKSNNSAVGPDEIHYEFLKQLPDESVKCLLTFRVHMGSTFSYSQHQEEGVPQGSILSITLFSIKINNIVKCLSPSIDCALYVDFIICYRATDMNIVEQLLQQNLNKVNKWARENGFKFSKSKLNACIFAL